MLAQDMLSEPFSRQLLPCNNGRKSESMLKKQFAKGLDSQKNYCTVPHHLWPSFNVHRSLKSLFNHLWTVRVINGDEQKVMPTRKSNGTVMGRYGGNGRKS
jgi:hypothetical protein